MNQEEKTLDECCSFEHKWKIARGHISKSIRRTRLKFSPRESTTTITSCAKFNRNLRCRVLCRDFFGRSVVECPSCESHSQECGVVSRKLMDSSKVTRNFKQTGWFKVFEHGITTPWRCSIKLVHWVCSFWQMLFLLMLGSGKGRQLPGITAPAVG